MGLFGMGGREQVIWESGKIMSSSPLGPSSETLSVINAQRGAAVLDKQWLCSTSGCWAGGDVGLC